MKEKLLIAFIFSILTVSSVLASDISKKVESMRFDEDLGLYEVIIGGNVVYMTQNQQYMIVGNIFDLKTQKNITQARNANKDGIDVTPILKYAITVGNGKKVISVFSDPLCLYCREFHNEIPELVKNGFTVNIFLYPLSDETKRIAGDLWCAGSNSQARFDAFSNFIKTNKVRSQKCDHPIDKIKEFGVSKKINSTPTVVLPDKSIFSGRVTAQNVIKAFDIYENTVKKMVK